MAIGVKNRGQFANIICLSDNDLANYILESHTLLLSTGETTVTDHESFTFS
jgi:hypothetical protein